MCVAVDVNLGVRYSTPVVRLGADCASGWGQSLLSLVENTTHDSFELYYGLFLYNPVRLQLRAFLSYHQASRMRHKCFAYIMESVQGVWCINQVGRIAVKEILSTGSP